MIIFCILSILFLILLLAGLIVYQYRYILMLSVASIFSKSARDELYEIINEFLKKPRFAHIFMDFPVLDRVIPFLIPVFSFCLIFVNIFGVVWASNTALNAFAWGSCSPDEVEKCVIGESLTKIDESQTSLVDTFVQLKNGFEKVEYNKQNISYYNYDEARKDRILVLDLSCETCRKQIIEALDNGWQNEYNLGYLIVFNGDASKMLLGYLEAVKTVQTDNATTPPDWALLTRLMSLEDSRGRLYLDRIISSKNRLQLRTLADIVLEEMGYNSTQIQNINNLVTTPVIEAQVEQNNSLVRESLQIKFVPTVIDDGYRKVGLMS